jgi:hypothetical protein
VSCNRDKPNREGIVAARTSARGCVASVLCKRKQKHHDVRPEIDGETE